jgi:hypothetical protein
MHRIEVACGRSIAVGRSAPVGLRLGLSHQLRKHPSRLQRCCDVEVSRFGYVVHVVSLL